jgi:DNA (cytosine-5)-methyltransferase 1
VAGALQHHINNGEQEPQTIINYNEFYDWLCGLKKLSEKVKRDTVSRLKRANTMRELPPQPDSYYLFTLEQSNEYKNLTPTVRSQVKRAVNLYTTYRADDKQLSLLDKRAF